MSFGRTWPLVPLWDDYFSLAGTTSNVFVVILGNAPNREFVVEWRDVRYFLCRGTDKSGVTFQAGEVRPVPAADRESFGASRPAGEDPPASTASLSLRAQPLRARDME